LSLAAKRQKLCNHASYQTTEIMKYQLDPISYLNAILWRLDEAQSKLHCCKSSRAESFETLSAGRAISLPRQPIIVLQVDFGRGHHWPINGSEFHIEDVVNRTQDEISNGYCTRPFYEGSWVLSSSLMCRYCSAIKGTGNSLH
jgi:hypothetical protein